MADSSYDAVFIGGGHNALVTALYLARNNMKVAVFDRRNEIGGEFCSDELPAPGFLMNTCATFIRFFVCPALYDFKLREHGLELVMPEPSQSMLFDDGSGMVIWGARKVDPETGKVTFVEENFHKNLKAIAQFSEKDAETCEKWAARPGRGFGENVEEWLYNPPTAPGSRSIEDEILATGAIDPRWPYMTIGEVAYDLFESDAMRVYFMRLAQGHAGSYPHIVQGLMSTLHQVGSMAGGLPISIAVGGTHTIAHALQRALSSLGGKFFVNAEVDKIVVENGRAKGIILADGSRIEAKQLVVNGADPRQLAFRFLDPSLTSNDVKRRLKNLWGDNFGLIWATFALHELPKYTAEKDFPGCMTQRCYLAPLDPDYLRFGKLGDCHRNGLPSRFFHHLTHDTAFVPSYAPPGKHLCLLEDYTTEDRFFTKAEWEGIRKRTAKALLDDWRRYAPNMTEDNVIDSFVLLGPDLLERFTWDTWSGYGHSAPQMGSFRPIPEWSGYRTHIKNLYGCAQSQHPGGSSWGLPGYNCYKAIAADLSLEKVWETAGRRY
ncbi:MAG: NAD(P)/FAD-dependent oxidoreductase [Deltaproteobacteria bacterium]|nr:NAD(P)/FAD-dependent oxidoreductase [Deltaproteobacteria bacterium]